MSLLGSREKDKKNINIKIKFEKKRTQWKFKPGTWNSPFKLHSATAKIKAGMAWSLQLTLKSLSSNVDNDNIKKKKNSNNNNCFHEQNGSSERASGFLVHFFGVHYTTTT